MTPELLPATEGGPGEAPADDNGALGRRMAGWGVSLFQALLPIILGMIAAAIVLLILGKNPIAFYADMFGRGLFNWEGLQDSIIRMSPLLLMAAGLIIAFTANIWNIGGDGQFLMGAAMVAGLGPALMESTPQWVAIILLIIVAFLVGGVWTIVPAYLKAKYTINEIITSLMMSFVGINLANLLIKGPFRSDETTVPQTFVIPYEKLLPDIPGTRIHVGVILAFVVVLIVHYAMTRTSFGMRLRVMGANPKAAVHSGISVFWFTIIGFFLSGALIATGAATEILGVWGYVRADWNPNWGLTLFALVFLARLNALATIPIVFFFAIITIGGHFACREVDLPDDFILVFVGFILLFMALTEYLTTGRIFRRMPGDLIAIRASQRRGAGDE